MKVQELFNDIKDFCIQNADEEIVKKYSRYFKDGYNAYGLQREQTESKVKEIMNQCKPNLQFIYDLCKFLVKEEKYEMTSFAILLLNQFAKEFNKNTLKEIGSWFNIGITNWGHTDGIAMYFFPVFFKNKIIVLEDLEDWRFAENKFQRRVVPVAMIKLLKHDNDFQKLFDFIDPMMMDPEREVHQGIGWFLRECWKIDRKITEDFLLKWKNDCARLIIQYATEKMTKEERLQFRRDKK